MKHTTPSTTTTGISQSGCTMVVCVIRIGFVVVVTGLGLAFRSVTVLKMLSYWD